MKATVHRPWTYSQPFLPTVHNYTSPEEPALSSLELSYYFPTLVSSAPATLVDSLSLKHMGTLPPQGLCTYCFHCPNCSLLRYPHSSLPHFPYVFVPGVSTLWATSAHCLLVREATLERRRDHVFMGWPWLLLHHSGRALTETTWLPKPEVIGVWLFTEKFC